MSDGDTMVWLALPGGRVTGGNAPLRLLIVPRLQGALADSELADWPAVVRDLTFEAELRTAAGAVTVPATQQNEARLGVWQALFGGLGVHPYQARSLGGTTVAPTSANAGKVVDTYAATARAPDTAATQLASWNTPTPSQPGPGPGPPPEPELDFHRFVSMLREHPAVLRALGLVVELTIPASSLSASGSVRINGRGLRTTIQPGTLYEFDGNVFLPASAGDITKGMLDLRGADLTGTQTGSRWEITAFDVDGAVDKLRSAARSDPSSLPHLRSTGLMLVRRGRQQVFDDRHAAAAQAASDPQLMPQATFAADALLLGYRIDIRPKDGDWSPLCARTATYRIGAVTLGPAAEEGQVKPYAATANGGTLSADEVVARWDGWSLVLPRPALGAPARPAAARRSPTALDWTFDLGPGPLPELRFGHSYEIRARAADLAGGSLAVNDSMAEQVISQLVAYTRFEPVPAPVVSDQRLVLRSDRGMNVAQFAAANPRYPAASLTLTVPPTTLAIAEQHGMLDGEDKATFEAAQNPTDPASAGVAIQLGPVIERRPWLGPWPGRTSKTLSLAERTDGTQPELAWSEDNTTASVSLAQAEQSSVRVSSYLPDDFLDRFAIRRWLEPGAEAAASGGQHPMVTPARDIPLIHAVRKPLRDPSGTLRAEREHGQTWTSLVPSPDPLNLDPASTAQVQITATWDEWADEPQPTPASATVQSITMHTDDATLPPLRHEFGDTKHRAVTYTVTGTSRFRQYFADDEPDAAFRASTTLPVTPVPSSAQPIPPVILGVRPAFSWEFGEFDPSQPLWDGLQRTRRGGRLRIELARPWFTTGAGEQLAVLRMVLGRDPVWSTPDPDGSPIEGMTVHQVWRSGDSWYADVETPPTPSYAPFVRLTVARHQPNSLSGLELSDPVDTDIVQVLPDRTLIVQRQDDALHVVLQGIGPSGPQQNGVDVFMEHGSDDAALTRLDGDEVPSWQRVPGASVSGPLNTALPPLAIPQTGDSLRIYVREVERPGASPSSGELAERVVFADYVFQFPVRK
jgi:hypothetical protein